MIPKDNVPPELRKWLGTFLKRKSYKVLSYSYSMQIGRHVRGHTEFTVELMLLDGTRATFISPH